MAFKLKGSTLYGGPMKQKKQEINPIIGNKTKAQQRKEFDAETARINARDNVKPVSNEKKGRPSVKNSKGETVYLSSANEKGQPMSRKEDR